MAIGALVAGCRIADNTNGGGGDDDVPTDAPSGGGDAPPAGNGFELCGTNLCVDLTNPKNSMLATAGGSRVIQQGTKKIMIGRVSETEFVTMSAICTHAGCTVRFVLSASQMQCPCHGSKFSLDGTVANGPATKDLVTFANDFDMAGNLLTITLV